MITTIDLTKGFSSDRGWNLCLPMGWKVLPKIASEITHGLDNVEVFAHPNDPSLSITWMCSSNYVNMSFWKQFSVATMSVGAIDPLIAQQLMSQVFPLMGKVVTAFVVSLGDGQRALELTEEILPFGSTSEPMRGYHLLVPVRSSNTGGKQMHMQQIVFYARQSKFAEQIVDVIHSARSFQHLKP